MIRALAALVLLAAVGCKRTAKDALTGATADLATAATATATANAAAATATASEDKRTRERAEVKQQALALLAAWVDAQNRGDAAAYFALYDGAHFKGVKRTRAGATTFDFAGWKDDRAKMMRARPKVQADDATVDSWLDAGSKLKRGAVEVHFTQRWQSAHYADHGEKVLSLWRDGAGKLRIVYEDLLNSEPGWAAAAAGTLALAPPKDDDAALAAWKQLAPTGADYAGKLASIPEDPEVRRPLARALLRDGNFDCKEVEQYDECGESHVEWKTLDPQAGLDDPCLRRKLAVWALGSGMLTEADSAALLPSLKAIANLPEPEDELPKAVLALPAGDRTRLALFESVIEGKRLPLVEEACCGGLSPASVATLYETHHVNAAAAALDPIKQRKLFLDAVADNALDPGTRGRLLATVAAMKGHDAADALAAVAVEANDCGLAMDAAEALAARGDSSRLPRRPAGDDGATFARALCLLARDRDPERRLARFREFLPPRGRVTLSHTIDNEFAERDADGNKIDTSPEPRRITRKSAAADDLPDDYGAGPEPQCDSASCSVPASDGHWDISFKRVGGKLYIDEIHRHEEHYCPC